MSLFAPFTTEKVRTAVFAMDSNKSLGLDGLNPNFFKNLWDISSDDVTNAYLLILFAGRFPH